MSREDYEAISKIIEEVVGKDTLQGEKFLEGIRFYFKNKKPSFGVVVNNFPGKNPIQYTGVSNYSKESRDAMHRYTEKLKKESEKYKKIQTKNCSVNS